MIKEMRTLRVLADENRLRLLLLLREREMFVCQLMAVTGLSQPLVSRSLALLAREWLVDSRRQGKRIFYRLKKDLSPLAYAVIESLAAAKGKGDGFDRDRMSLDLFCRRFQRGGDCDMDTVKKFIEFRNKNKKKGVSHGKTGQKSVH